jgi:hypothetical protein
LTKASGVPGSQGWVNPIEAVTNLDVEAGRYATSLFTLNFADLYKSTLLRHFSSLLSST